MPKPTKFNGKINGKPIKVIVELRKGHKKQVMAKPKPNSDVDTPHFVKDHNIWTIHQDSADGKYYRTMQPPIQIASGLFGDIQNYVRNSGLDLQLLPIQKTADGFSINTNPSGVWVTFPADAGVQPYYYALAKWGEKKEKNPRKLPSQKPNP